MEPGIGVSSTVAVLFNTNPNLYFFFFLISKCIMLGMMCEVFVTFWYMITTVRRMEKSVDLLKYICVNGWLPVKWNQADVGSWLGGSFMVTCQSSTSQWLCIWFVFWFFCGLILISFIDICQGYFAGITTVALFIYDFSILKHWGRDKMDAISQTTFLNAFPWMKMCKFRLRFHWKLFPRVQLAIFHHCFR